MIDIRILACGLLLFRSIAGYNQCIGVPEDQYYFCESISQNTLHLYLQKAASFGYVTAGIIDEEEFNKDIEMLQSLKPKWLGRVAGEWFAGENDSQEFSNASYIAGRIHNEVDASIILQAGIYEHLDRRISGNSDWKITIPDSVFSLFSDTPYIGYTGFFEFINMAYPGSDIPDMSKPETQMWFYYRSIQYINAGYESLHMGQFQIMNNSDSLNIGWNKMLSNVRNYAHQYARRKLVLIDCHFVSSTCQDLYFGANDIPYLCSYKTFANKTIITPTDSLLFDFVSFTLLPDEFNEPIPEQNNPYDGYDRLCLINYKDCTLLNRTFTGKEPQYYSSQIDLPMLVEMDNGGTQFYDCEGFKTNELYSCNADADGALETPEYLTWGFGGESVWYALQSPSYRHYFSWYAYHTIPRMNRNCHFRLNLRMPITYSQAPWPGVIYNASNETQGDAEMIKWLWNDTTYKIYAGQQIKQSSWVHGISYKSNARLKKLAINIDDDLNDEIIGVFKDTIRSMHFIEDSNPIVNTLLINPLVANFSDDTISSKLFSCRLNNDQKEDILLTSTSGILLAISSFDSYLIIEVPASPLLNYSLNDYGSNINTGDFNGDGYSDLIFVNSDGIWICTYNHILNSFNEWELWYNSNETDLNWSYPLLQIHPENQNNDINADCALIESSGTYIFRSDGSQLQLIQILPESFVINDQPHTKALFTTDLTGDGISEIIGLDLSGVQVAQNFDFLYSKPCHWIYGISSLPELGGYDFLNTSIVSGDFNADTKADLFAIGGANSNILLSSGYCFVDLFKIYNHDNSNFNMKNHDVLTGNFIGGLRDEVAIFNEFAIELITFEATTPTITSNFITSLPEFNIYPNPTKEYLAVRFNEMFSGTLQIFNQEGQRVYFDNQLKNCSYKEIRLPDMLESGMYILTITDTYNNRKSKKIILL